MRENNLAIPNDVMFAYLHGKINIMLYVLSIFVFVYLFIYLFFYFNVNTQCFAVPVLVLLFVALWFILRGDLFYVLPCFILFLCFTVLLAMRLPRLGKRELVWVLFVRLFDLRLFGFVCFLFLFVSGKGCGLWLWHSMDFSLTPFLYT